MQTWRGGTPPNGGQLPGVSFLFQKLHDHPKSSWPQLTVLLALFCHSLWGPQDIFQQVLFDQLIQLPWCWILSKRPQNCCPSLFGTASLLAQLVKNLPAMQETPVRFLGREESHLVNWGQSVMQREQAFMPCESKCKSWLSHVPAGHVWATSSPFQNFLLCSMGPPTPPSTTGGSVCKSPARV